MKNKILENLNTKFLGKRIDYYEDLESTHKLAKSMSDKDICDGMIILTDNQTAGIGTHDRNWITEKGKNLTFNIILVPNKSICNISDLTAIIAKCIVETLEKLYEIKTSIEKPNDIILNKKKLAGILTESISQGEIIKKIYIGIGLNVNQEIFDKDLNDIATSLKKEYHRDFSKEEILKEFLEIFEKKYIEFLG